MMFQPDYTDCENCGTVDHNDYNCPCGCHEEQPSRHLMLVQLRRNNAVICLNRVLRAAGVYMNDAQFNRAVRVLVKWDIRERIETR
jgi:hypothetical protein